MNTPSVLFVSSTSIARFPDRRLSYRLHFRTGKFLELQQKQGQHNLTSCMAPSHGMFSRRQFIRLLATTTATTMISPTAWPGTARGVTGLHVFPLREPLSNSYYLMRACECYSDAAHVTTVNPIDRLSLKKMGLTRAGANSAVEAADALFEAGISEDSWIWPSITISAFETAEIVASRLRIRRDHIVPEFAFLDARGVGALEGLPSQQVLDILEKNDRRDPFWRPQPGEDGTPNDSAQDVFVRVTQLISKLETQYFAEDIIIIAPDSDNLSIWQAAVTGRSLTEHPQLHFDVGEVRRVREVVVDAYGEVVEPPLSETIYKPA